VLGVLALGLTAERALSGNSNHYQEVSPDAQGRVIVDVAGLEPLQARFYRFLNAGNQEVRFFVARDENGAIQAAFDASENEYKLRRGFRAQGAWIVNNKCGISVRLDEVNQHVSGCAPVPVPFRVDGSKVVLAESDVLDGWRYFR
jgi:uncharacterized membrane protein